MEEEKITKTKRIFSKDFEQGNLCNQMQQQEFEGRNLHKEMQQQGFGGKSLDKEMEQSKFLQVMFKVLYITLPRPGAE